MPKLLSSKDIIAVLQKNGFAPASQKGSHLKLRAADGRSVIVPTPRKQIPIGTLNSIIKQSRLDKKLFL